MFVGPVERTDRVTGALSGSAKALSGQSGRLKPIDIVGGGIEIDGDPSGPLLDDPADVAAVLSDGVGAPCAWSCVDVEGDRLGGGGGCSVVHVDKATRPGSG